VVIVAFNRRAEFLFFEKDIDIAKDRVEVAQMININNVVLCNIDWLYTLILPAL